jgi:SynChlorMet cassette radical SAM/SPASM protein ScmF
MPASKGFWLKAAKCQFLLKVPDRMPDIQIKDKQDNAGAIEFPLSQLYFYLTKGCNLACRHCWLAPKFDPHGDKQPVLPLELFKQAIEEAMPLGLSGVKLTGGEPLLHPDFLDMLNFLKQKRLKLTLETNGLLCSPEIAAEISGLDESFVSVSLDGADAATHDKIRGAKGAFQKSTAAVRSLSDCGLKPQVIMSVMHGNVGQLEAVIQLAEELGAASVKFNVIQPTGRGENVYSTCSGLTIENLILLGRKVETKMAAKSKLRLYFDYPAAFRSLGQFVSGDGCGVCSILSILGVLPTGEYALCGIGSHVPELIFGRIAQDNLLEDVWKNNTVLNELRSGLPKQLTGICHTCLMKNHCLGSCIAQNYYRTRSLWTPFWFCEQAEAQGLFPPSRRTFL